MKLILAQANGHEQELRSKVSHQYYNETTLKEMTLFKVTLYLLIVQNLVAHGTWYLAER